MRVALQMALLSIYIEQVKMVNDVLGHDVVTAFSPGGASRREMRLREYQVARICRADTMYASPTDAVSCDAE